MNNAKKSESGNSRYPSRLKSDKGRRILKIALREFLKHGFNGCDIEKIAAQAKLSALDLKEYIYSKKCLALACMDLMVERFNEISFGDEMLDLYGLHDGEIVALLPVVLLESSIVELKQPVMDYYKMWANHFCTCGNRLDDTLKNFDETSNHYAFWAWLGFWIMAHTGALPISDFKGMRDMARRGGQGDA